MRLKSSVVAVACGIVVGVSGLISSEVGTVDLERTITGTGITAVDVQGGAAHVVLHPTTSDDVHVHLQGRATGPQDYQLVVEQTNGQLQIRVERKFRLTLMNEHEVTLDVALPQRQYQELLVATTDGHVQARDLESATASFRSEEGSLQLTRVAGTVKTATESGEQQVRLDRVTHDLELTSATGSVQLDVPRTASFQLHWLTRSGEEQVHQPIDWQPHQPFSDVQRGLIGAESGPQVAVTTKSGDLVVRPLE